MRPRALSRMAGFTVTEMIIVVGIVAILAAVAAPNMSGMIRTQRVKTAAFDVFASLTLARSEAIKRNVSVTVTPSGGNWANGWQIADANGNVLKRQGALDTLAVVGPNDVRFNAMGRLASAAGNFTLTAEGVPTARCIRLDLSGRAVSQEGAC